MTDDDLAKMRAIAASDLTDEQAAVAWAKVSGLPIPIAGEWILSERGQPVDQEIAPPMDAPPLADLWADEETEPSPVPEGVAVREHGEMGPVIGDPEHDFTSESDL